MDASGGATANAAAQSSLNNQLHAAAAAGDVAALRAALDAGANVDVRKVVNELNMTPLCAVLDLNFDVSVQDREACVRALLEAGASPSEVVTFADDYDKVTGGVALHDAAHNGWYAISKLLLDAGADVNARYTLIFPRETIFKTPLLFAAREGNQKVIALLLSRGAVDDEGVRKYSSVYLQKIRAAGGFANYEKQHRAKLVAMLAPKFANVLPPELVSVVISFWAHVGFY